MLLWQKKTPLVFLRPTRRSKLLFVNLVLDNSNADKHPAFIVMLHRFVEMVRAGKTAYERRNVETGQILPVPGMVRAPESPGVFSISHEGKVLFDGAARFADLREADMSMAATLHMKSRIEKVLFQRNNRGDHFATLWLLLLAGLMAADWRWQEGSG